MEDDTDAVPTNPYLALRAAKIARNQARLKELGLHKPAISKTANRNRKPGQPSKRKKRPDISGASVAEPRRRSRRISGLSSVPNYIETKDFKERGSPHTSTRQTRKELPLDETNADSVLSMSPPRPSTPSRQQTSPAPAAANSVRTITLDVSVMLQKFLAKPMETFGKYFVIERSFGEAACPVDQDRLQGVLRLSFNKFSGVQPWKNVTFLWINVGGPAGANALVNEFTHKGSRVTWFGGSRMTEDSPVIQNLIRLGKEAASTPSSTSSGILLWCRQYDYATRKLRPYTCLGRLAYESHVPGSYPVAFTWRLIDHKSMMENKETRTVFGEVSCSDLSN